ncbi:MAG: hypothetical protein AABX47_05915 [Nanoarchaeota archaeon]
MPRPKTSEEAYESCLCKGLIKPQEDADLNRITSIIENSSTDIEQAKRLATITPKDGKGWTTIFKIQYDALRELAEAIALSDKANISNHQCLFAHICERHQELELDWGFLEKMRTKRNGINYHGSTITYQEWKETELQMDLYAKTLRNDLTT